MFCLERRAGDFVISHWSSSCNIEHSGQTSSQNFFSVKSNLNSVFKEIAPDCCFKLNACNASLSCVQVRRGFSTSQQRALSLPKHETVDKLLAEQWVLLEQMWK
eukprot:6138988-Amphidinium_carterae.1